MSARSNSSTDTSTVKSAELAGVDTTTNGRRMRVTTSKLKKNKSLEQWIWDAACSNLGQKDAPVQGCFNRTLLFRNLFLIVR